MKESTRSYKNEGNQMTQDILTSQGTVVTRQNLRKIRKSELICES